MGSSDYDSSSSNSILEYSKKLSGKSLSEVVSGVYGQDNLRNKGNLGSMVEEYFFQYRPNSSHSPDFEEAGVELKTTGVIKASKGGYKAKERLVLTMINYMNMVNEEWSNSALLKKCSVMLLLFYLYDKDVPVPERKFVLNPILFYFPGEDYEVIKKDWEVIKNKIQDGKAHELSEGDTYYLGACRKGSGGPNEKLRQQPFSSILAKSRAFSLKPSYVNKIINNYTDEVSVLSITSDIGFEEATQNKFAPFIGKTIDEISDVLNYYKKGKNDKGFYRNLTLRMLGVEKGSALELDKAGVELKTIRVNDNWVPAEAMSFPTFKYMDIIEEDWEESSFFNKIEQKFLFVIFKEDAKSALRLEKIKYWNMPYEDREEARRVWEDTKSRVKKDARDLPKSVESPVAHVRPKARNAQDTLPTPQGEQLIKKCFWLNKKIYRKYVEELSK